jgi:hypothetical protein
VARAEPVEVHLSITRCPKCRGRIEPTVVSGPVLRRRRRLVAFGGARSTLRGETCTLCGYTLLFAERPGDLLGGAEPEDAATA